MTLNTVCRLCLATDAPVHNIVDSPLRDVYEKLTDISLTAEPLPAVACFLCFSQLKKCHKLMVKSVRADKVLTKILRSGQQVNVQLIAMKNGEMQQLNELGVTPLEVIVIPDPGHNTINENVKEEPLSPQLTQTDEEIDTDRRRCIDFLRFEESENEDVEREVLRYVEGNINKHLEDTVEFKREFFSDSGDIKNEKPEEPETSKRRCIDYLQFEDSDGDGDIVRNELIRKENRRDKGSSSSLCNKVMETDRRRSIDYLKFEDSEQEEVIVGVDLRDVGRSETKELTDGEEIEPDECEEDTENMETAGAAPVEKCKKTHDTDKTQDGSTQTSHGKNILEKQRTSKTVIEEEATSRSVGSYMLRSTKKISSNRQITINTSMYCDTVINKSNVCINSDNDCAGTNTDVDNSSSKQLKMFICNYCSNTFDDKYQLIEHIELHNTVKKKRKQESSHQHTKLRKTKYNKVRSVIKHTETHSGQNSFECEICQRRFNHKGYLKNHIRVHTGEKPYECDICQVKFSRTDHLKIHLRLHTGEKPYECDICKVRFSWKKSLKGHLRLHTGEKPYECEICRRRFNRKAYLKNHIRVHTGEKPYECDICKVRFGQRVYLRRHFKIHTGEKPYECEICKVRFGQKQHLKRHFKIHTGEKPYKCEICKVKFSENSSLKRHLTLHTGEKPYECEICRVRFSENRTLKSHLTLHTGERPHECETCKARFSENRFLKRHLKLHTGVKPYECEICGARFCEMGKLNRHLKSHTKEKLYECEICKVKFSSKGSVKSHLRLHTGEKC